MVNRDKEAAVVPAPWLIAPRVFLLSVVPVFKMLLSSVPQNVVHGFINLIWRDANLYYAEISIWPEANVLTGNSTNYVIFWVSASNSVSHKIPLSSWEPKVHWHYLVNLFLLVSWGGLRPSPFGTSATIWPILPAPDDGWWVWSSRWNERQMKPKYWEKTCRSVTLSTTNPTWLHLGSSPHLRGGNPATNSLSYVYT
jgi:hypothetical protein